MIERRKVRDSALIDALENAAKIEFVGRVYRVTRGGRDPLRPSASGGRWDDGSFEVLYTSREADGAIAEVYFHLMRGEPVFPSKIEFFLTEINVELRYAFKLADFTQLAALGVDIENYGSMSHVRRHVEYTRTQEIAEIAHFLGADGIIVPNARLEGENLVLFTGHMPPDALSIISKPTPIDSATWRRIAQKIR